MGPVRCRSAVPFPFRCRTACENQLPKSLFINILTAKSFIYSNLQQIQRISMKMRNLLGGRGVPRRLLIGKMDSASFPPSPLLSLYNSVAVTLVVWIFHST